ncbi:MAG TPA: Mpo1-like protein [Gemmatimonadales bacterium]|nr:Mpo1-like protein [Gemmatimonadales bacterium]
MQLGNRPMSEWVARYAESHKHPVNRFCHTFGIPMIVLSLPLFVAAIFVDGLWPVPTALFVVGWMFQFFGHYVEGKPPEFLHDWRFLFVGLRWWVHKVQGKA